MTDSSPCLAALDAFMRHDFAEWQGLPARCGTAETVRIFPTEEEWIGEGKLGTEAIPASYRFSTIPAYASPVRIWFADEQVLLLEAEEPLPDLSPATLVPALGPPSARLDAYFGVALLRRSEWVYAQRGIAFNTDSTGKHTLGLRVFVATTVENYTREVRTNRRLLPMRAPSQER